MIFHLISKADWDAAPKDQPYRAASLDAEGFIHCTKGERGMLQVANAFYKTQPGEFLVLHIDESKLTSEVKWEAPADPVADTGKQASGETEVQVPLPPAVEAELGDAAPMLPSAPAHPPTSTPAPTLFPHVYGPINREAIVGMRRFTRADDGTFTGYAQIDDAPASIATDPSNPLNLKSASQLADELLGATDDFSESLKRFKDRIEGRMAEIDEKIKKL